MNVNGKLWSKGILNTDSEHEAIWSMDQSTETMFIDMKCLDNKKCQDNKSQNINKYSGLQKHCSTNEIVDAHRALS